MNFESGGTVPSLMGISLNDISSNVFSASSLHVCLPEIVEILIVYSCDYLMSNFPTKW